jgi:hypothetical protein
MIVNNKLDKSFGPVGTSAGILVFIVGVISTFFSLSGVFLVLIGAFVGFTSTSAQIDYDNKRLRLSNNLFGVLHIGRWIDIEPEMKIGLKKSTNKWRAFSMSNRTIDVTTSDFRIILYDSNNKQLFPLKKTNSFDSANMELEELGIGLDLKRI